MSIEFERMPIEMFLKNDALRFPCWLFDDNDDLEKFCNELRQMSAKRVEVELDRDGDPTGGLYIELDKCIPIAMIAFIADKRPNECSVEDKTWLRIWWD